MSDNKDLPVDKFGLSERFAVLNKLITKDLNKSTYNPTFYLYTKDQITDYLANPAKYEEQLRNAVIYIYGASPHFRRIIQYFTGLTDFSYYVSPYRIDPKKANVNSINRNYRRVLNMLSSMSIKTQFPKIVSTCLREDTFFGTAWITNDNITIQQLPFDYCKISSIEGNVPNVTFNFNYFDSHKDLLEYYPEEFRTKYDYYRSHMSERWIELDCPNSFAVKCNSDILDYSIPPFAGLLRDVYDLEDYRQLKKSKSEIENYALLAMKLPMDSDGNWQIDFDKAQDFWRNLDSVMPEEIGSVLTPMDISKISFEKSNTGDTDTVEEAEENLFTSAGVSSLLFNNSKASANALALSIKVDQEMTYGIVKGIEDVVNRLIQAQSFGKNFKVTFMNVSAFNRKEVGDALLKASSYGLPTISMYASSQGLNQAELDAMSFLETDVLGLVDMFKPVQNSAQVSSEQQASSSSTTTEIVDTDKNEEGGRPTVEDTELSDSGEETRELSDDWG